MRVHDFVDEGLGHSSYLIDLGDGTAAVVDPPRFPIGHEQTGHRSGLRVAWTLDTHSHADYVTGSSEPWAHSLPTTPLLESVAAWSSPRRATIGAPGRR